MAIISDEEIDAGAQALRQRQQGGKQLIPWDRLTNTTKRKWRGHAECVLTAAASVRKEA